MAQRDISGERLNDWDTTVIDRNKTAFEETNNYRHEEQHVVLLSTCFGLLAVCGMLLCILSVIVGRVLCTPEKNKMRYVSRIVKSCIQVGRHCRLNISNKFPRNRSFIDTSPGKSCVNSFGGEDFMFSINKFQPVFFANVKAENKSKVSMSGAESTEVLSTDMEFTDIDTCDPFQNRRLSEVVAEMLDIDPDSSDVISDVDNDSDNVTAFIDYNEEPRNKGLYREPLKTIEEEDDNVSQTDSNDTASTSESNGVKNQKEAFEPRAKVVRAKSVETVFGVYPSTTESAAVSEQINSVTDQPCTTTKFRWSVTSV